MTPERVTALLDATWPPRGSVRHGPWRLRNGAGGGKRVSAASADGRPVDTADMEALEARMARPLVRVAPDEAVLDRALVARGYRQVDPTLCLTAPVRRIARDGPERGGYWSWPPLAIQAEIWADGGVDAARIDVMHRAPGPKVAILGRHGDAPAAVAFVALGGDAAMLHALEVRPAERRAGVGRRVVAHAAHWARAEGAATLAVLVTEANAGARAFYAALGFEGGRAYHYRMRP